jgi:hypothetical protein
VGDGSSSSSRGSDGEEAAEARSRCSTRSRSSRLSLIQHGQLVGKVRTRGACFVVVDVNVMDASAGVIQPVVPAANAYLIRVHAGSDQQWGHMFKHSGLTSWHCAVTYASKLHLTVHLAMRTCVLPCCCAVAVVCWHRSRTSALVLCWIRAPRTRQRLAAHPRTWYSFDCE